MIKRHGNEIPQSLFTISGEYLHRGGVMNKILNEKVLVLMDVDYIRCYEITEDFKVKRKGSIYLGENRCFEVFSNDKLSVISEDNMLRILKVMLCEKNNELMIKKLCEIKVKINPELGEKGSLLTVSDDGKYITILQKLNKIPSTISIFEWDNSKIALSFKKYLDVTKLHLQKISSLNFIGFFENKFSILIHINGYTESFYVFTYIINSNEFSFSRCFRNYLGNTGTLLTLTKIKNSKSFISLTQSQKIVQFEFFN